MKLNLKKYYLALIFIILSIQLNFGQGPEVPPGCDCSCTVAETPEYFACVDDCNNGNGDYCATLVPINANILILFTLAISFGTYTLYRTNKKRRFEN